MIAHKDNAGRWHRPDGTFAAREEVEQFQRQGRVVEQNSLPGPLYDAIPEVMRGMIRLIRGMLKNADVAYRRDRQFQRQMRQDPDVMGPLLQRQIAVALLEWEIVPEDGEDETQVDQANKVRDLIVRNLPKWPDFIRQMQEAVWFGIGAVNMIYDRVRGEVAPVEWRPFHSDTIVFNEVGQVGMKVGWRFQGPKFPSWEGLVHMFEPHEREALVLQTYMAQGPDYEELEEARYAFSGRGYRDIVYYFWLMKQVSLQLWMTYVQRYGMGSRIGTYPDGNDKAKANIIEALRNLIGDVSVVIPDDSDLKRKSRYGINILDPPAGEAKVFADLIEGYLAGQIKELLIGQTATTEATTTGLGSDVGTRHAETFTRLIKFDALNLADTLTRELVWRIHLMNFGDTPHRPRIEFALEHVDSEEFMTGVQAFVGMGGKVSERQVRGQLGLDEPREDEPTLGGDPFGGLAGGGLDMQDIRRKALAGVTENGDEETD